MTEFVKFPKTPHLAWLGAVQPRDDNVTSKDVLDALQMKSTRGAATPAREIDLIRRSLALKARLTLQIHRDIKARDLTQVQAGESLGIKQPQVPLRMRNRSGNFSVERLMAFLTALGNDVEIRVKRTRKPHGQMSVVVAAISFEVTA